MLFKELYDLYWRRHAAKLKEPKNVKYWWSAHGDRWAEIRVPDIKRGAVQDWADDLAEGSPSASRRAVHQLSAILNWGAKRGYHECPNPCRGVDLAKPVSRDRFLLPGELKRFLTALEQESATYQDFFRLCLFTAARRGNIQSMRWEHLDLDLAVWRIAAAEFKNGETQFLALNEDAVSLLRVRLESRAVDCPWVFPGPGKKGHIVDIKRAFKRITKRAGLTDLRPHDLRRTTGSYMAMTGASLPVIGKALGHRDQRSTAVYAKLNLDPVRKALDQVREQFYQ